jgi:RNA polymerase sigma-54 factor
MGDYSLDNDCGVNAELDEADVLDLLLNHNDISEIPTELWHTNRNHPLGFNRNGKPHDGDDVYEDSLFNEGIEDTARRLIDHLHCQLPMGFDDNERNLALEIINNLDSDGYLRTPLESIARGVCGFDSYRIDSCITSADLVLKKVQKLDPLGVAARCLQECLIIQASCLYPRNKLLIAILNDHTDDLEKRDYNKIAKSQNADLEKVFETIEIIRSFKYHPAKNFDSYYVDYVRPDIFIKKVDDYHLVEIISSGNYFTITKSGTLITECFGETITDADYKRRVHSIFIVTKAIVERQYKFFDIGNPGLVPLTLSDISSKINLSESTISKITSSKYIQTSYGSYLLKYFLVGGLSTTDGDFISSTSIKDQIRNIINSESSSKPLSDQKIADMLSDSKVIIARRTVTKYREMMKIGSTQDRRKNI